MPLPLIALAAASAIPGLSSAAYKFFKGNKQVKEGKKIEKNNKFINYQRPGEVVDALNISERNYTNGMPGSDLLQNRINSNAGTAFHAAAQGASSSADVLDAATKINANTNNAFQDLTLQEKDYKLNAQNQYLGQLNNSADYSDKEFQYNVAQPYARKAAAASALIGAGEQNKFSGIDEGMGVLTDIGTKALTGGFGGGQTMGDSLGLGQIDQAGMSGVKNSMGGLTTGQPLTMGTKYNSPLMASAGMSINSQLPGIVNGQPLTMGAKYGNPEVPNAQSIGPGTGMSNPAMVGQIIADMRTGLRRWSNK